MNNSQYLKVKELLNKVPKNIDISFIKRLIKEYEEGETYSTRGRRGMVDINLSMASDILRKILREVKK